MNTTDMHTATSLLAAIRQAARHGGAEEALAAEGVDLAQAERFDGLAGELETALHDRDGEAAVPAALALGYLAGRTARRPRRRVHQDPTAFVMDSELVVQRAEGESILRLPWFEDELFVGRQLPDISEMPASIRSLCIQNYTAALDGERGRFSFVSYGHAYSVEAVPVRAENGGIEAVLAVATPGRACDAVATSYERMADRLDRSVDLAEQRATGHLRAGRIADHDAARREAERVRCAAERSRAIARRLRSQDDAAGGPPTLSPRETEVLALISHGLDRQGVAEVLAISPATVKTHLEHVFEKLGVSDRAAAVAAAMRHGLIQ